MFSLKWMLLWNQSERDMNFKQSGWNHYVCLCAAPVVAKTPKLRGKYINIYSKTMPCCSLICRDLKCAGPMTHSSLLRVSCKAFPDSFFSCAVPPGVSVRYTGLLISAQIFLSNILQLNLFFLSVTFQKFLYLIIDTSTKSSYNYYGWFKNKFHSFQLLLTYS